MVWDLVCSTAKPVCKDRLRLKITYNDLPVPRDHLRVKDQVLETQMYKMYKNIMLMHGIYSEFPKSPTTKLRELFKTTSGSKIPQESTKPVG